MSVDPDLRIALGFMLLLRCAVGFTYRNVLSRFGIFVQLQQGQARRMWAERIVWILLTGPILVFLWDVEGFARLVDSFSHAAAVYTTMWMPVPLRWLLLVPAVVGLLLQIWT